MIDDPAPDGTPRGSGLPAGSAPADASAADVPVVMVVSADWAGPSRPAPTVLRELGRRWGAAIRVLLVEDPSDEQLALLGVEVLPTWLRFVPHAAAAGDGAAEDGQGTAVDALTGVTPAGDDVTLPGPWRLVHRRTGAQPKHVIEAEFGPEA